MWDISFGLACEVVLSLHWVTVRTGRARTEEESRGTHIPSYVSNSEMYLIISSHFLSSRLLDSSIVDCSSNTHFEPKIHDF